MSEVFANLGVEIERINFETEDEMYELSDFNIPVTDTFNGNENEKDYLFILNALQKS